MQLDEPVNYTTETLKIEPTASNINNYDAWLSNAINGFIQKLCDKYKRDAEMYVKVNVKQHKCPKVTCEGVSGDLPAFLTKVQNLLYDSIYKRFSIIDIPFEFIFDDNIDQSISIDIGRADQQ